MKLICSFLLSAACIVLCLSTTFTAASVSNISNEKEFILDNHKIHSGFSEAGKGRKNSFLRVTSRKLETTTTRVNICNKLKDSLVASLAGLLLILVTPFLIWYNEKRHVQEIARIQFCKNKAVVIDCDAPTADTEGCLVHFVGTVTVADGSALSFGLHGEGLDLRIPIPNAIYLKRTCQIYQSFEESQTRVEKDNFGGGETRITEYSIRDEWTSFGPEPEFLEHEHLTRKNSRGIWDQLVSASEVRSGINHGETPDEMTSLVPKTEKYYDPNLPPHGVAVTKNARVGSFHLSEDVIVDNPSVFFSDLISVPVNFLRASIPECEGLIRGSDNVLRTFVEGQTPENGDCKVEYEYVKDGFEATFIVQQVSMKSGEVFAIDRLHAIEEHCFGKCNNDLGEIWMVRRGRHSIEEMIDIATGEENTKTAILRFASLICLLIGWYMLFSPFVTALQVLPFLSTLGGFAVLVVAIIVSCLCCGTFTFLAYFRHHPLLTLLLLTVVGSIWGFVAWRFDFAVQEAEKED